MPGLVVDADQTDIGGDIDGTDIGGNGTGVYCKGCTGWSKQTCAVVNSGLTLNLPFFSPAYQKGCVVNGQITMASSKRVPPTLLAKEACFRAQGMPAPSPAEARGSIVCSSPWLR